LGFATTQVQSRTTPPRPMAEAGYPLGLHESRFRCSQPGGRTDGCTVRIHGES